FRASTERASRSLLQISSNVASIQKLLSLVGTPRETDDVRQKLHNLTEQTRDLVKATSGDLKDLGTVAASSGTDSRQRKITHQKLQKDFEDVLKRYQSVSKSVADKSRTYVEKARASQRGSTWENPIGSVLQIQGLDYEIEYNESLIAERERDIKEIEKSIVEVNEIFRDLGTMVNEQQYMLDNIEANVSSVAVNMENATDELRTASKYQKMSRNRMCCLLLVLAIIAIIVVAIIL
ncbi:t-SNARE, partial [Hyaloraphidium curvatum]